MTVKRLLLRVLAVAGMLLLVWVIGVVAVAVMASS